MRARMLLSLAILLGATAVATARLTRAWTYQEMFDAADLVVIARPTSTKDTDERSKVLDDIPVVGVFTEFETRLVLKGPKETTAFTLHHYRLESTDDLNIVNGPWLIDIQIQPHRIFTFLLFLRRERDGVYAPVTDQTDPAGTSVIELPGGAM